MDFYAEYFRNADCYGDLNRMFEIGKPEAMKHGIPVIDVLHIAAANLSRCSVLFTTEGTTKPLFRTKLVRVASILDANPNILSRPVRKALWLSPKIAGTGIAIGTEPLVPIQPSLAHCSTATHRTINPIRWLSTCLFRNR